MLLCAGCYSTSSEESLDQPKQIEADIVVEGDSMNDLITKAIHTWLDDKMDDRIYGMFNDSDARWKSAKRISSVVAWFDSMAIITKNVAWTNFYYLVEELRWHNKFDLSEKEYLTAIKESLTLYSWQQEDEF